MTTVSEVREKYINFFVGKDHRIIPSAPIVPKDDPTTLFTSSGMQQLVPYLMGRRHPLGRRLVNSQPCIRVEDINNVGNSRSLTYFEMLGNWSLGDYFKEEQLSYFYEFLTKELGLDKERIFVTYFEGNGAIPKDEETISIWRKLGVKDDHIYGYGVEKNWWSRCGEPKEMSVGEIGGPDSEVFYCFDISHSKISGGKCHPNCDCGCFVEMGNSVFMEYIKKEDGAFEKLPQRNVDFGGGLERLTAVANNKSDIFETDVFEELVKIISLDAGVSYGSSTKEKERLIRGISDHIRTSNALMSFGIEPSNKLQGYILRRIIRRAVFLQYLLTSDLNKRLAPLYEDYLGSNFAVFLQEEERFKSILERGIKKVNAIIEKGLKPDAKFVFDLYQSEGFPPELSLEMLAKKGEGLKGNEVKELDSKLLSHRKLSQTASAGAFKSGLADRSEETKRLHTATHLLHAALRKVLGNSVVQKGSNITAERLRFDFSYDRKLTDEELSEVETLVNDVINRCSDVDCKEMSSESARKEGALALFGEKYGERVTLYSIGDFSKEVCAGPHVENTKELGRFKIIKQESVGSNVKRIKAVLR